ncbi:MAG: Transport permease protein [Actinomycetota bacterium]|jgi:ABC-2 type transport system permease protein|nr:Transport permease protein [Actinomycetota bacterium]
MNALKVLGGRGLREALRTPDALLPTLLIPLFFLVVNVGQAARIFPTDTTPFLKGQSYAAFQLPATILLAASFGTAALYLVEEIENGYFDKIRATPVSRTSIALGRLISEPIKIAAMTVVIILVALPFGVSVQSGIVGVLLLVLLAAGWATGYAAFLQFVALKTRSAAATNSAGLVFFPLLFLTPNFVPRDLLTDPMEVAATLNPVTYVMEAMRSLILEPLNWAAIAPGFIVVAAFVGVMLVINVHVMRTYD